MHPSIVKTLINNPCHFSFFSHSYSLQLLLMKSGGQLIYGGPLGSFSESMVQYFEVEPRSNASLFFFFMNFLIFLLCIIEANVFTIEYLE